jgi:hypothetical protein
MNLRDLLPGYLEGWTLNNALSIPSKEDLYSYIDGGAELYISYGFSEAISCKYVKEGQAEVTADIYDLLNSGNAFGVFTQTREKENTDIGQGAYRMPGAVFFWKERYYISLSSWESSPEAENFLTLLADHIDKGITSKGEIPGIISLLPEKGLVPNGFIYFHHYIWLNAYVFISGENIFGISDKTDAVIAKYAEGEGRKYLLVVKYRDHESAMEAFNSFGSVYFPSGLSDNCILTPENMWVAAVIRDNIIAAVFKGSTMQSAAGLLADLLKKINL